MRFVGVDLAWGTRGRTGLAVLDVAGLLLDLAEARTDEEILAWLRPHAAGPCLLAIDAHPHAAIVALFGLPRTLKYKHKPGRDLALLRAETLRLLDLVETLADGDPAMVVSEHPTWREIRAAVVHADRKADLKAVEDRIDAVLCAYVALLAVRRPDRTTTFGDAATGAIVTPTLRSPRHP